jgi:TonB-dependent receptor
MNIFERFCVILPLLAAASQIFAAADDRTSKAAIISEAPADIKGRITDSSTGEPLIGAAIVVEGEQIAAISDLDGYFVLSGLVPGKTYNIQVSYIGSKTAYLQGIKASNEAQPMEIKLEPDTQALSGATVTGFKRTDSELSMVQGIKNSDLVVSGISAQEIARSQDSDAGQVIRRIPGISLIEDKFVMVRGLSQRYNNVWINGGVAPSSEADSRAFSFDIIPSSQLENLEIIKTPSPEYPADYSGGFISITTKDIPARNSSEIMLGSGWNTTSTFQNFLHGKASGTDWLGFDDGMRNLDGGISAKLNTHSMGVDILNNGFDNDWKVRESTPLGDIRASASFARRWDASNGTFGLTAALNYTSSCRKFENMANNLFGVYDTKKDRSTYLRFSTDDQYNKNVRAGALLNLSYLTLDGNTKIQFKNILNQLGNSRYTWREGVSAQSDQQHSAEYYYSSRTTYNAQLTGKHILGDNGLDWSLSYSFAGKNVPDRKMYLLDDSAEAGTIQIANGNDIQRQWTRLHEHIMSLSVNDEQKLKLGDWNPTLKIGAYSEYRNREYLTRDLMYSWDPGSNTLPSDFRKMDITELLSNSEYFGPDKLYIIDEPHMRNNYDGKDYLAAGYVAAIMPFGKFSIHAGVRYEWNRMVLTNNTKDNEKSPFDHKYSTSDLFPSINMTYRFNEKHQVRLSYGHSINRPEFREVSPSVFYDFDLASNVQGNTELDPCYIYNGDIRYEFYPSRGETISVALFYKYFDSPIEWTYTVTGGTDLVYSFLNAKSASSKGIEMDFKKSLDFIGLRNFSIALNGSIIDSDVKFPKGSKEENRPMQGQSPYLVNAGIFYHNDRIALDCAVLYNRIGKRIIGVGRAEGSTTDNESLRVPDSYEMPRNVIDLSASKHFSKHFGLKLAIRDLLAEDVNYKQFAKVHLADGTRKKVEELTRRYKPGTTFLLSLIYKF